MPYDPVAELSENLYYLVNFPTDVTVQKTKDDFGAVIFVVTAREPGEDEAFIVARGRSIDEAFDRAANQLDDHIELINE